MRRQIEAVRKLGRNFEDATAYVIVEANLGVTAATVYSHLAGMPNVEFMWTARAANDGRLPGGMVDADGGIRAGLWTLNKHKHAMMDRISAYLRSGRIHWYSGLIGYATTDPEREVLLLEQCNGDDMELKRRYAPTARNRDELFQLEARQRNMQGLVTELGNMSRILHEPAGGASQPAYINRTKIIITGKLTKQLKDDRVLALGVGLMGAIFDQRGRTAAMTAAAQIVTRSTRF